MSVCFLIFFLIKPNKFFVCEKKVDLFFLYLAHPPCSQNFCILEQQTTRHLCSVFARADCQSTPDVAKLKVVDLHNFGINLQKLAFRKREGGMWLWYCCVNAEYYVNFNNEIEENKETWWIWHPCTSLTMNYEHREKKESWI